MCMCVISHLSAVDRHQLRMLGSGLAYAAGSLCRAQALRRQRRREPVQRHVLVDETATVGAQLSNLTIQ